FSSLLAERRANAPEFLPRIDRDLAEAERALTDPTVASRIALKLEFLAGRDRTDMENEAFDSYLTQRLEDAEEQGNGDDPLAHALLKRRKNIGPDGKPLPTLSVILEKFQSERQLSSRKW